MGEQLRPMKLKEARKLFRAIFSAVDIIAFERTAHFRERQLERGISDVDVYEVSRNGFVKKEYPPDLDHPRWRWSFCYKKVALIFSYKGGRIVLITCWRGKEPPEGER
ncbi:MAG: DUF4258 domain-containing protein [Deltaproteobacteria bacterium]|nr:DUF4258 domain-containing protein [Deltaproteobacteria bacterium]MBI2975036.1 DUF4258 domain-containing protein [Deltaproteobacteria bacterium]